MTEHISNQLFHQCIIDYYGGNFSAVIFIEMISEQPAYQPLGWLLRNHLNIIDYTSFILLIRRCIVDDLEKLIDIC
jgi:hypothetical protein